MPVFAGVLSGLPTIEAALGKAVNTGARRILVYPYFMAAGFFVSTRVPQRIAGAGASERCRMLGPLGADPGLPALVLRRAAAVAVDNLDQPARACRLLLVGHGSKVARASAEATEAVAAALRRAGEFASIETAFLEEAPFLDDVIGQDAEGRDARPTVIVGLFNGDGLHAGEDVPAAMQKAKGPVAYTGAVGAMPEVADLIAVAIETAAKELRADVLA